MASSEGGVISVSAAYQSGPEFWITASGVTGWLGFGEKDVYRINQATVGARSISVRALPSGGEYLVPKLCLGPVTSSPVMPDRCANAAPQQTLPTGESYVVVFNDAEDVPGQRNLRGDSIKYVLELQF